jgi:GT2 family glycosyltransferase
VIDAFTKQPSVVIVVLNWNGRDDTLECLRSLAAVSYGNFAVIVVDNGSVDGSVPAIRQRFPEVAVVETGKNLGYAGGNNAGIRAALEKGVEFILLLNNDTIVAPDILDEFVAAAHRFPNAAALGGKIYRYEDMERIWWADAHWVEEEGSFVCPSEGALDSAGAEDSATDTDYTCGCAMFMRAALIREVGLLDAQYFLTFEETDWCFRVRRLGYHCLVISNAKIWHKGSASFKGGESPLYSYFFTRNRLLFAERHLRGRARAIVWQKTAGQFAAWAVAPLRVTGAGWKRRYWALRAWLCHLDSWWSAPGFRATRLAIRDYLLRRFGDCPPVLRELNRAKP